MNNNSKSKNKNSQANKNTSEANSIGNRPERSSVQTVPMENKRDVEQSNDNNIDKDFPGYPHYPASEDIMNPRNHTGRVTAELDANSKRDLNKMHLDSASKTKPYTEEEKEDLGIVEGTEADVTAEDLLILGSVDRDIDRGEDEERLHPSLGSGGAFESTESITDRDLEMGDDGIDRGLQRTGDDLDVPGQELDDMNEMIGEEDEENNYYSLGGDEKEGNEEDNRNNY